jgi:alkyldihydroxyacetonephosphate synthase
MNGNDNSTHVKTQTATRRLQKTLSHLKTSGVAAAVGEPGAIVSSDDAPPRWDHKEHDKSKLHTKWNGWGYADTKFFVNNDGNVELSGNRYSTIFNSRRVMPEFRGWVEKIMSVDLAYLSLPREDYPTLPDPIYNKPFLEHVSDLKCYKEIYTDPQCRLFHGHGHTCQEIFELRHHETTKRMPDVVIYPGSHEHVVQIMEAAVKYNVVIIPYGGGTSVSGALECPENEKRMIVSLDMQRMNQILWVDRENMMACIEAGALGQDISDKLEKVGLTMGHHPDSEEFSSIGGWVSTRASGMKKNVYGNIEDIVINFKLVTPTGVLHMGGDFPRISAGPGVMQMAMGAEGTLGVVTEVLVRLQPLPTTRKYSSVVFSDFTQGVLAMREVARRRCAPISIRLMDNIQFQFGQALKPQSDTPMKDEIIGAIQKAYLFNWQRIKQDEMCAATLLFEGTPNEIEAQERAVMDVCKQFGGIGGGEENGLRGYFLTYVIAYLRDYGFDFYFLSESFETSVPWGNVLNLVDGVKKVITDECIKHGVTVAPFVCSRVTQTYDTGACVYTYFGFMYRGMENPVAAFSAIESAARDEVIRNNGSISHHHGVGKHRKKWVRETVSDTGMTMLKAVKDSLDPTNIMANGNII